MGERLASSRRRLRRLAGGRQVGKLRRGLRGGVLDTLSDWT